MLFLIFGMNKMDYAIDAALALAYTATLSEDHIGLLIFSDTVLTFLPPRKGKHQIFSMRNPLSSVQADLHESDVAGAFKYLDARWRRRSLLVCFTDLWDRNSSSRTMDALSSQQSRHLVMAITLRDEDIDNNLHKPLQGIADVYTRAAATQVQQERDEARLLLSKRGVITLDSTPSALSAELVSRYLSLKERMLL